MRRTVPVGGATPYAISIGPGLLDEPCGEETCELGVDLAVARRPGVGERLLEVLDEVVARSRMVGERAEECIAQCHLICQS